jgi:hypothetical protein
LPKVAVEVGVAEGRFSKELLDSGFDFLYLVDIWEQMPFIDGCASFGEDWHDANYRQVRNLFENDNRVCILKGFSHKMASFVSDDSLGLVYIDGDHTYNGCKSDIKVWMPKLKQGGIMAFHDYNDFPNYGVKRAVIEFMKGENEINIIEEDGKQENIGAWIRKQ